jgi:hypothetical protein
MIIRLAILQFRKLLSIITSLHLPTSNRFWTGSVAVSHLNLGKGKMQQSHIFRYHEFLPCFFGVSPCPGTSWFREYTSQISMSNVGFHVEKVAIPAGSV